MYPAGRRREVVVAENQAASGQRSVMRSIVPAFGTNTRVRQETISTVHPMRLSAGRSVSAGPSISTRLSPIRRLRASRQPLARGKRIAPLHHGRECFGTRHGGTAVETEARSHEAYLLCIEHAPDERHTIIRREPAHPHVLGRQAVPHRQEQAGSEPEARLPVAREFTDLVFPEHAPMALVGFAPVRGIELGPRHAVARGGADQLHAFLHPTIVEHARRGRQDHRGPLRTGVEDQPGIAVPTGIARAPGERGLGGRGLQPVTADNLDPLGNCPGAGMVIQGLAAGDGERIRDHGLHAELIAAGLDRLLDIGGDAVFQLGEELVLLRDGERQQPVEELRHRRQLVLEPALVDDLEAGRVLEPLDVPALDPAAPERAVELAERRLRVGAFQVVALAEQRRVAAAHGGLGIPLAPGDGAQTVEPAARWWR